ncbi:Mitogen-activated protein kinase kinase kinase YODA isoform I [Glycine soja]|uniref:Mitogen-activated protein kinase kinase kinase YODA isoform H n=1 Tax=Glycine soja TaxID=3848 RepID=A0A445HW89_GLYSO|nr:Mitogen-activated protein kinase kinase kinase YODA isoform H [Glycine soja]RZB77943.1 Mitogen-activated protein kinase kinase kinase YODA isoform I [Glycine soja]
MATPTTHFSAVDSLLTLSPSLAAAAVNDFSGLHILDLQKQSNKNTNKTAFYLSQNLLSLCLRGRNKAPHHLLRIFTKPSSFINKSVITTLVLVCSVEFQGLPSQIAYGSWQKICHTMAAGHVLPFNNNDRNVNPSLGFLLRLVLLVRYIPLLLSIMWNRIVLFSGDLDGMYEFAILQTRIIDLSL